MKILLIILLLILITMNIITIYMCFMSYERKNIKLKEPMKPKLTKEQKDKQEQLKKSFDNLMNYDESVARKIRK